MSDTEQYGGISRRMLVKSSAIGSLALAAGGLSLPFGMRTTAAAVQQAIQPAEEKVVWGACSVNCGSRCALQLHVKDDEVVWVESDTTGDDIYGQHQVRACLRGRSIRRRINHPDRLNYPMKRVGKRGEGKFERITWQEALDTISTSLKNTVQKYGNEAVYINYTSGIVGGNITRSSPYASLVARLMNCYGGFLSHYGTMLAKDPALPSYDELKKMGIYKRKDPNGHFVAYKKFRDDPQANPLKTPSGKIEIYSSRLAKIANTWELQKDEVISPLPVYASTFEGWDDPKRSAFPLQLFGFHYKSRTHSSYGNIDVLQASCRQEVWINPVDAQKRGIANGDMVRVFNDRGEVRIPAKVTPRILPGVSAMGQGAWHDADMAGDKIDHGACVNTLTTQRPSPLAKGNPQHTNLVEIEKV
ncbi:molybdopterin dinucleotide binding domain-containing protein [Citrobacter sp. Cpo102]|uniref:molybdopterin dinucleotide binding domain-containing protein n=1 Tax=Citrobacter sp. Cpo102 TaxID=2985142 RepID=UPI002579219E|nr:molybdopterin dinucleotide binding domain-containing protein [Citrobacter sp. Cpo102]MDM2815790.1 molybdopterin-dependent oxidoreductase [Citrobacter sp. Cpo102]